MTETKHPHALGHPKLLITGIAVLVVIVVGVAWYRLESAPSSTPTMRWLHQLSARYVFWRTGFTHWSSGPGIYTYDPYCPLCRFARLFN
ncbi:MAG: hypothetical protein JO307_21055 [Bryobacterales bacterium]|nr:hypothetical protein [Bryobacterales bacterium]